MISLPPLKDLKGDLSEEHLVKMATRLQILQHILDTVGLDGDAKDHIITPEKVGMLPLLTDLSDDQIMRMVEQSSGR